ncbi:MAG: hypothetical protein WEC59_02975 [Salibacteraceae bacterium]
MLFTFNIDTQTVEVINDKGQCIASVETISKHIAKIEQEIEEVLPSIGLNPKGFSEALHFEIPEYELAKNPIAKIAPEGLSQWKHFRKLANNACFQVLGLTQTWEEIRIWPHHFDTGIYIVPTKKLGIGFGLAMEDGMAGAPYFYLSGYPLQGEIIYKNLPQSEDWEWKTGDDWKGATLKLDMLQKQDVTEQLKRVDQYIIENVKWFLGYEN